MKRIFFAAVIIMITNLMVWPPLSGAADNNQLTLAISPLKNLMKKEDLDWMREGFAETLTTKLNHVRRLNLVERVQLNEIMQEMKLNMAGITEQNASSVGKLAGADFLIIGSFQKLDLAGRSTLKINTRVVNVRTGLIEKGKAVEVNGPYETVFQIQDQLAAKIAGQLNIGLSDTEMKHLGTDETTSILAYELYNQATSETDQPRKEKLLLKALQEDPHYAKAHLLLGSYYSVKALTDDSLETQALSHLNVALENDPELFEAHSALGDYYYRKSRMVRKNMDEAEEEFIKKAIYHLNKFVEGKINSKAKYYIKKVEKAKKKLKKLES